MHPVHNSCTTRFQRALLKCILLTLLWGVVSASCRRAVHQALPSGVAAATAQAQNTAPQLDTLYKRFGIDDRDSLIRLLYRRCEGNLDTVYARFAAVRSALPRPVNNTEYLDTLIQLYTFRIAQSPEQYKRLLPVVRQGLLWAQQEQSTDTLSPYHVFYHIRQALRITPTTSTEDIESLYYSLVTDAFLVDTPIAGYLGYCLRDTLYMFQRGVIGTDCSIIETWTSSLFAQVLTERDALFSPTSDK